MLKNGDIVRVHAGPFVNLVGPVERIDGATVRVRFQSVLGVRELSAPVNVADVRKIRKRCAIMATVSRKH